MINGTVKDLCKITIAFNLHCKMYLKWPTEVFIGVIDTRRDTIYGPALAIILY